MSRLRRDSGSCDRQPPRLTFVAIIAADELTCWRTYGRAPQVTDGAGATSLRLRIKRRAREILGSRLLTHYQRLPARSRWTRTVICFSRMAVAVRLLVNCRIYDRRNSSIDDAAITGSMQQTLASCRVICFWLCLR